MDVGLVSLSASIYRAMEVWMVGLHLLSHLQQGVNGSVLVALLGLQHRADHLLIKVGEHVLKGLQVLLAAGGTARGSSRYCWHSHRHHTLIVDTRDTWNGTITRRAQKYRTFKVEV